MYHIFAHDADYVESHFGAKKQPPKQKNFAMIFAARARNIAIYGTSVAMDQKNSILHIAGAAIIADIISK